MGRLASLSVCMVALAAYSHTGTEHVVFTAAGDYGTTAEAAATLDLVNRSNARFHLALGDLAYNNEPEARWCDWVANRVGTVFPFMLIPGNHEDDFGEDGHITRFAECLPDRLGVTGTYPSEYLFDYEGLVRVIVISPDLTIKGEHYYYGDRNAHYKWLVDAIDGARAAGLPWVVVGMHKSCVSVGPYYCKIYSQLMDLLLEKRVDVILQGHDHSYQRTKQLALGPGCPSFPIDAYDPACVADHGTHEYVQGRGTIEAIVATGGQEMYTLNPQDPEAGYFVQWMGAERARHGLLRIEISREMLSAAFVPATDTSDFADRFVIRRALSIP
jgi:hypothetical protein